MAAAVARPGRARRLPGAAGPRTRDPGARRRGERARPLAPRRLGGPAEVREEVPPLPFGVTDLPSAAGPEPAGPRPSHGGHLLIAGTARAAAGPSALRTLAGSIAAGASPEDVHLHAVDCGSGALLPLVALPHCGAVVTRSQLDRVERLLTRLRAEVGRRQQILAEAGYASLAEARQSYRTGAGAARRGAAGSPGVRRRTGRPPRTRPRPRPELAAAANAIGTGLPEANAIGTAPRRRPPSVPAPRNRPASIPAVRDRPPSIPVPRNRPPSVPALRRRYRPGPAPRGATTLGTGPLDAGGGKTAADALRMPWLVLMLDRWEGFAAAFEGYDYGRLLESFMQLLREGPAVGLRAVVTSDRSGLLGQISTLFEDRLIMRLADPADYGLAGLPPRSLPSAMPPGRAISVGEQGVVESQIALLCEDPSGPVQVAALQALARESAERFPEPASLLKVDALPMRVAASQALDLAPGFSPPSPLWALLGAGGDSLAPLGVDLLAQGPAAVIAGPSRSGRSSALLTAARSLLGRGTAVAIVTPRRSPLRELSGETGVLAILGGDGHPLPAGDGRPLPGGEGQVLPGGDGRAADLAGVLAGHGRYVVIVDDAELVSPDSVLGMALEDILRSGRDGEHGLLIGGTTGDLATAYRGFVAEARKARTGMLLSVQSPADGDLFNVRLPRGAVGGPPAGDCW